VLLPTLSTQSTRGVPKGPFIPLLNFAPDEVCRAIPVTRYAVGSYPTLSPLLTVKTESFYCLAVYFLLHCLSKKRFSSFLSPGITRHHALRSPDFPLAIYVNHNHKRQSDPSLKMLLIHHTPYQLYRLLLPLLLPLPHRPYPGHPDQRGCLNLHH